MLTLSDWLLMFLTSVIIKNLYCLTSYAFLPLFCNFILTMLVHFDPTGKTPFGQTDKGIFAGPSHCCSWQWWISSSFHVVASFIQSKWFFFIIMFPRSEIVVGVLPFLHASLINCYSKNVRTWDYTIELFSFPYISVSCMEIK